MTMWRLIAASAMAAAMAGCGTNAGQGSGSVADTVLEPAFETPKADLDANLRCLPFTHPDKPPVLLVHGTFTAGNEQYNWTYVPLLDDRGFDVCTVTYPDRGLGDQQISAEYVVNALRSIYAQTGRKVAMIGHSQGATMPRWALKYWPSARDVVEDFVMQAGPNHGTTVADPAGGGSPLPLPEAFWQFAPSSNFIKALNHGDETPGDISYTNLYTTFDELVEPSAPVPTAALEFNAGNPKITNLLLQDLCPGRFVDHVTIGLTDRLSFELALDAISNPGPANVERAGGAATLCGLADFIPDQIVASEAAQNMVAVILAGGGGIGGLHLVNGEPPLKAYAQADGQ
jgi:triacylglycerol lipase